MWTTRLAAGLAFLTLAGLPAASVAATPPTVITDLATVDAGHVTLNARVNPNGRATIWRFEYGLTTAYGKQAPGGAAPSAGSGTTRVAIQAQIAGLQPGKTYHFRARANNGDAAYGKDRTFTTAAPPTVTANPATNLSGNGATLNATINPNGAETVYRFEYGTTTAYGKQAPGGTAPSAGSGNSPVDRSAPIIGLEPDTTYHYRVRANNGQAAYSDDATFTTASATAPIVRTFDALPSVGAAELHGTVNPNGRETVYRFEYGKTTAYGMDAPAGPPPSAGGGTDTSNIRYNLYGLEPGATYHYRIWADNGTAAYGADKTFTTWLPPTVETQDATDIGLTSATLNATINPHGQSTGASFQYGLTTDYGSSVPATPVGMGNEPVDTSAAVTKLQPGTTYHYRAVGFQGKPYYGDDKTFTTLTPPTVTVNDATNVTPTGATLNATINPNGKPTVYRFQYRFSANSSWTDAPAGTAPSAGDGTDPVDVSVDLTGLYRSATYSYRVWADNGTGTKVFSTEDTFMTPGPPEVETKWAEVFTGNFARVTGYINPNGLPTVYRFEYGLTTSYGQIAPVGPAPSAGSGFSSVIRTVEIRDLQPGTYHYRVRANNGWAAYGEDRTFTIYGYSLRAWSLT